MVFALKVSVGNALTRDVFSEVETAVFGHDSGLWMRMFRPNDARRKQLGFTPSKLNRFHEDLRTRVGMVR